MCRRFSPLRVVFVGVLMVTAGCAPQQPFFFLEDGDLSHYIDKATEIEYPDVETASLDEVTRAMAPLTVDSPDPCEIWELTLEEAIKIALHNSKVIRQLPQVGPGFPATAPDFLIRNPEGAPTVYDPALVESNPRFGVEAALAAFDAQFTSSVFWEKNDTPRNPFVFPGSETAFPQVFRQDVGTFQAQLQKVAATGATWSLRHNVSYDAQPDVTRLFPSDWSVNVEAEFRQPLLQRNGVQFNRIAGPGAIPGFNNGVMIARVNTDISLAQFEGHVRNLVNDVEKAYWTLYLHYRRLKALREGRDKALGTWREVRAELEAGKTPPHNEAQARHQYYEFRAQVEDAQSQMYSAENNLRYIMGLAASDGRLIRPADEPTTAKVHFDWCEVLNEGLVRFADLRRQRWQVKQRELELIAAKNYLLPRLDSVGRYRWLGLGDHLIDPHRSTNPFDNAYQSLTGGDFQEWQLGLELSIPFGFRKELAGVRYAQLNLARERAVLQDMELELSHQLSEALRNLDKEHALAQTQFNKRLAAEAELKSWEAREAGGLKVREETLDRVLDAQRRLALADIDYYTALANYNIAIAAVHFRKGSLLEYNGVYLAEGPWPEKAYFDATRRARARDASFYLDYGFTRPKVVSRGAVEQHAGSSGLIPEASPVLQDGLAPEAIPAPEPEPFEALPSEQPAGPTSMLEKAEAGRMGPGPGSTAAVKIIAQDRPGRNGDDYDLGALDLKVFAATSAESEPAPPVQASAVRQVGYQHADPPTRGSQPERGKSGWRSSKRLIARHESVANPPTPEADRDASGWKKLQR